MRLSLKLAGLSAAMVLAAGPALGSPGGRFGAAVDAAADGCLGAAAPDLEACAASLSEVEAIGARLFEGTPGSADAAHYLVRRAAIELRLSALQAGQEGATHTEVCHWAKASAQSAAGVVIAPGDAEAETAYRGTLEASAAAVAACLPEETATAPAE